MYAQPTENTFLYISKFRQKKNTTEIEVNSI